MTILPLLAGATNVISGLAQGITNGGGALGSIGGGNSGGGNFGPGFGGAIHPSIPRPLSGQSSPRPNQLANPNQPPAQSSPSPVPSILPSGPAVNPDQVPNTGATKQYDWVISRSCLSPDGVQKCGIFINGQYPGPTLEADWGDTIEVTIHNNITEDPEGTSIHWHGLKHKDSPWMDGVPSVSQCPIVPAANFTYTFRADSFGTSWYHAHYSAQYSDGVFGPMIIHGPSHVQYDIDIGPVLLNDYYHEPYIQNLELVVGEQFTPPSDNNLINGKMPYDCANANGLPCQSNVEVSKFRFQSGRKHLLRLINAGSEGLQRFRIDNHKIWIIANDFVQVKPYQVDVVTLSVGQRSDIIVEGTGQPTDAVWMRSDLSRSCSFTNQPYAQAAVYYENADNSTSPQTTSIEVQDDNCINDALSLTEPAFSNTPPSQPAVTTRIDMEFGANATGDLVWTMNNQSFRADYGNAILLLAKAGNTSYPNNPEWNVYNYENATSIRLILTSISPIAHPMHLHGHNFWVLAEGFGEWNGTITRPENPQRRDTHSMEKGNPELGQAGMSYIVIEFLADNPGVWPMHCHNAWHLSNGMYINVLEHPDAIRDMPIPDIIPQTCRDWAAYTANEPVLQIDSGV